MNTRIQFNGLPWQPIRQYLVTFQFTFFVILAEWHYELNLVQYEVKLLNPSFAYKDKSLIFYSENDTV